ncbi:MAG: helix-turn-helix domain-containing protein, partial [Gammaproteobacteria bacterium]|nr:helix-turn-helix domain-containing protein [Gammaproteobacteria bacterium]
MTPGESPGEAREGPGETLQAARLAMEVSCREVAEALNLPIETVEAIEANDYERLPAPVFTRGYIRAYAKLLELDSDPVVARFPLGESETQTAEVAITPAANPMEALVRQKPRQLMGVALALGLVVLIALVVWLAAESEQAPEGSTSPPDQVVTDETAATVAEPSSAEPAAVVAAETSSRVEPAVAPPPATVSAVAAEPAPDIEDVAASTETPARAIDPPAADSPAIEQPVLQAA